MSIVLKVPAIGESITEVVVGDWFKAEGDWVQLDENVVVVESDKVNLEVPSPIEGKLLKVFKQTGDTAQVGETIAELEEGAIPEDLDVAPGAADEAGAPAVPVPVEKASEPPVVHDVEVPRVDTPPSKAASRQQGAIIMPAAARLLAEHGLTSAGIRGSGRGGRVLKEDVLRHIDGAPRKTPPPPLAERAENAGPSTVEGAFE